MKEFERLKLSIPQELQEIIEIESVMSKSQAIASRKIDRRRCQIQIDLRSWQYLSIDLRNLLFWIEVASLQNGCRSDDRYLHASICVGLGIASIDLCSDNIGLMATSLLVAGLASFRLYQKYMGEENLQRLTAADRDAIELAIRFGYDRDTAQKLLKLAIQTIAKQRKYRFSRNRDAARLQVLSIS